ncbi:TniQ family protein [Paraburkholderia nemoris]|uniref:TniQ family protein n=1 Tax=Paraburkholderia nemoris TaxID=2793076 RepID=UPI0038BDCD9A
MHVTNRSPSILVAPLPFADESPASWIIRTCLLHRISYRRLAASLGINPSRDPDLEQVEHICRIGSGTHLSASQLQQLGDRFEAVRNERYRKLLLNFTDRREPVYRVCGSCLASDATPYFRIAWRLTDWTICPIHHERMISRCPSCHAEIKGTRPYLERTRDNDPLDLSDCPHCLASLTANPCQQETSLGELDESTLSVQEAILSIVVNEFIPSGSRNLRCSLTYYLRLRYRYKLEDFRYYRRRRPSIVAWIEPPEPESK